MHPNFSSPHTGIVHVLEYEYQTRAPILGNFAHTCRNTCAVEHCGDRVHFFGKPTAKVLIVG